MDIKLKKWLSQIPEYVPGRTIDEIKKEYNLKNVYKLASNENLYGPDPGILKEIAGGLRDIKFYPDSSCREVKQKLGEKYQIGTDCIVIGNGTDQIIEMICDGFIGPGENAVIADPTFLIYEKSVLKSGGSAIKVPLKDFRQDVTKMVKSIDNNTRVLFLTNPHNPTGTNISREEFEYVIENTGGSILVVVDEAYSEYVLESDKVDTLKYLKKFKNLVLLRTFSKIYGLAGLRIGYGIADSLVISVLNKIRLPFNINSLAQKAAVAALENESYTKKIINKIYKEKNRFYKVLLKNKIDYIKSYANFILINAGKNCSKVVEELLKNGFIVRPGKNLGLPGYIRVTIGQPEINIKFLNALVEIINVLKYRK
jgi:histidinol-phosphate aminotransferase